MKKKIKDILNNIQQRTDIASVDYDKLADQILSFDNAYEKWVRLGKPNLKKKKTKKL